MSAARQSGFAEALLDLDRPAPAALALSGDVRPERRFAVYRNNVAVGLIAALQARFPAVRRIVGDDFFAGLARAFAKAHPPRSPLMMAYGDDFADFVQTAPGLEDLPYPADVARLEAARTRAYHAEDAAPIDREAFAALDLQAFGELTITLHPSAEIVRSTHPIVTIWAMNAGEAPLAPIDDWRGEDALVARPEMEVTVRRLPAGGAAFLGALGRGACFAEAASEAKDEADEFDLTQNLIGLIEAGLAVGLAYPAPQTGAEP